MSAGRRASLGDISLLLDLAMDEIGDLCERVDKGELLPPTEDDLLGLPHVTSSGEPIGDLGVAVSMSDMIEWLWMQADSTEPPQGR